MVAVTNITVATSASSATKLDYVLITPARNEAAFIEQTIKCVVAQSARPLKWVIVSDGSTDGTDDIVSKYAATHDWIELVRTPERKERHFAGKVHAFNAGYAGVKDLPYDVIGNLDADLTFDAGYFQFLIGKFLENPGLGVAGTPFREGDSQYDYRFTSSEHVSGACQLFRRKCFEAIGGYTPLKVGGIDLVAVISARMQGWKTQSFVEKILHHHRMMGTGSHREWIALYRSGYHDYLMGVHPIWQLCRCAYQATRSPLIARGALHFIGYSWALLTRAERPVSKEFIRFRRREQMRRLRRFLLGRCGAGEGIAGSC